VDPEEWWRGVEVHLRGTFLCARAVLAGMIPRHQGRIINVVVRLHGGLDQLIDGDIDMDAQILERLYHGGVSWLSMVLATASTA